MRRRGFLSLPLIALASACEDAPSAETAETKDRATPLEELPVKAHPAGEPSPFDPGGHDPAPMALPMGDEPAQSFDDFLAEAPPAIEPGLETVALLPIGEFPHGLVAAQDRLYLVRSPPLERLGDWASRWLGVPVRLLPAMSDEALQRLPHRELDGLRQIDAASLIAQLESQKPSDCGRLMALTHEDLFAADARWVYGYANPDAGVAVHSLLRYDPGFAQGVDHRPRAFQRLILTRTLRVLSHELSHLFGLRHCVHFACVMNPTQSLQGVDDLPLRLCPVCLRKLDAAHGGRLDHAARWRRLAELSQRAGLDLDARWYARRVGALRSPARR